jgi:hypothetical protein
MALWYNCGMRDSSLRQHDAPDDLRAALDRVMALAYLLNGRVAEQDDGFLIRRRPH